jgi:hypothetical protein
VSDASLKFGHGTSAAIIEGAQCDNPTRIIVVNQVPGPISEGDSYRCELAGLISIVVMCNEVARICKLTQGKVQIACDNQSTLWVFEPNYRPDPQQGNFDLAQ